MEATRRKPGRAFTICARPDRADHAARGPSVLSGDPGGEGRRSACATPTPSSPSASRCSAWRSPRLFYGSLSDRYGRRPVLLSGLALFLFGSVVSAIAETRACPGAGPADPGDRRRLRADAGAGDRARRLPRRATGQGDRLSHHVRHARADGLADHRRLADRHARLAQRVRLRARWPAARSRSPPIWRCTRPIRSPTATAAATSVAQSYVALFSRLRFNAFVLQSGFNTGAFMVMASASASLMTELLHRPGDRVRAVFPAVSRSASSPAISSRLASAIASRPRRWCWRARCWRWRACRGRPLVLSYGLRDAAGVLPAGHLHHHGPGHRDALRPGRRHGGSAALCRHRGRRRRVHAEFLRGGVLAALRHCSPTARRGR